MSGNPWSKFFWQDWESDQALKLCSMAAQGLWMRMLCIAAAHDPVGYVSVAGKPLDETGLARLTGVSESEVAILLQELDHHGVFSRDRHGRIYSRRLVRDARMLANAKKNGKKGGNPNLRKQRGKSEGVNPPDKGKDKPHKPEARSQSIPLSNDNGAADFWKFATAYLGENKRAMIGRWCKQYGGQIPVAHAITEAQLANAVEPVAYIERTLSRSRRTTAGEIW